ncbi:hypothetical protein TMEN_9804 [Trichophyton mentagrophytes]|uniref:Mediator of RNA polymerase II transcription subunit 11 n=2 Tax=Trichophyton interdigitale TaxID=101480 RepID=A0A9P5CUW6_9EURO|nr:hypothetical protein H101_02369 [Trichophyton interdigitale H6]KAF3891860.1 Mediator of RNA polymerase II transcription subunit 11 [Trichophyton interdigitale]KDB26443.1 hypothetical protein H109_01751 [Trichophyton interdigitale MR816]GBF67081.1 hypothetical protein TMEN_9804 [Trichophyton mentagrophytes]KAF3892858.1 Mediator of RNA polymerase II transcription subunit 11 [Trichophyton interdigitale]
MASEKAVFSPADRINELNEVDKDVAQILQSAGLAIQSLTNNTSLPRGELETGSLTTDASLDSRKKAFKSACSQYFALVSSVDVKLRRQVYALEEASIIRAEPTISFKAGDSMVAGAGATAQLSPGTVNPLETSWLNSRKDTVGKDKEAELWAEASRFMKSVASKKGNENPDSSAAQADAGGKQAMDVD